MTYVNRFVRMPLTLALIIGAAGVLHADLVVQLGSTPASLEGIAIGEPINIDVQLIGLPVGDELDLLSATVLYDGMLLGTPSISPGLIVPNPLDDPLDLLVNEDTGIADVSFLTFGTSSADRIGTNGSFFSFTLVPMEAGVTTIYLDFVDAQQFNPADPGNPLFPAITTGPSLTVQIVPEPSTTILVLIGIAIATAGGFRRRIRVGTHP